jgi:hypothetical protein
MKLLRGLNCELERSGVCHGTIVRADRISYGGYHSVGYGERESRGRACIAGGRRSHAGRCKTASVHASEDAARLRQSAAEVGPNALEAVSRAAYTGSYLLAYGVVYATVFIAQPLP